MIAWNPEQYLRFGSERTRPSRDLASAVPLEAPGTILDAGCGPGNSTAVLKEFWPHARIQGVDASEEMLGAARRALPEAAFSRADLDGDLSALGSFDLVFSNAVLQWLADPGQGLSRLFALVKPGGALAVQVPACTPGPVGGGAAGNLRCPPADGRYGPGGPLCRLYCRLYPAENAGGARRPIAGCRLRRG